MDPLLPATFPIAVCRNKSLLTGKQVREFDSYCERSPATLLCKGREVSYNNKLNIPGHTQQKYKKRHVEKKHFLEEKTNPNVVYPYFLQGRAGR